MAPDDEVCLCFHVPLRKLTKFVRLYQPPVPSLMSECGGAGTGCMWCVPILHKIWKQESTDDLTATDHAERRQRYLDRGKVREDES